MKKETKWSIDQTHSEIAFKIKHLMIAHVKGSFKTFDASIYTTANDFTTAEIDVWIDVASITTGDAKRDAHLRGADFFDVANHPQITFGSSTIGQPDGDGNHALWGELTIKGITQNVKLEVQFGGIAHDLGGNEKAGFALTGKINRSDWGLVWNASLESGGFVVSDEVTISCEIELIRVDQDTLVMELETTEAEKTSASL